MASVLLVFLMATVAVSSVAASRYPLGYGGQLPQDPSTGGTSTSNEKVPKFNEVLGKDICKGAQGAVRKAKDKCCNDLGERGKCICKVVRSVVDSITFVQDLCEDYNACKGSWDYEAEVDEAMAREYKCKLLDDKEDKAVECNEALKKLKETHKDCFHILAFPKVY